MDDKNTAYLAALAGQGDAPTPCTRDEALLNALVANSIEQFRSNLPITYTVEVDQENNKYLVRPWFSNADKMYAASAAMSACVRNDGQLIAGFFYVTDSTPERNKKPVSVLTRRYYAKSWESDYDPAIDGILTDDNSPIIKENTDSSQPHPERGGGALYLYSLAYSGSDVAGRSVYVRTAHEITYDDGSKKTIWSSQINMTRTEDGVSFEYMHDPNPSGDPRNIVAIGWDCINHTYPEPESVDKTGGLIRGLYSNFTAAGVDDKYCEFYPEDFVHDGDPVSYALWARFADGRTRYYAVLSNPGILTASAPDENEPGT